MRWWIALMLAGCRLDFDPVTPGDGAPNGDASDGPLDPIDAPTGSVVETFGETPGSTITNVTTDTSLSSESPGDNFGAGTSLSLEGNEKRAVLRFDLSAIPAGKVVVSARLHVSADGENAGATVTIAPVLEAWTEGSLAGAPGVANFTERTATQSWTSAGAQAPGSAGAQIAMVVAPVNPAIVAVDLPVATVQGWIDTPAQNFGIVLAVSGGGDVRIASSESTTATNRPELVVTYFP